MQTILLSLSLFTALAVAKTQICNTSCPYTASKFMNTTDKGASATYWKPAVNTTWQIVLSPDNSDAGPQLTYDYEAYDLDLFDVDASVFSTLHDKGKKVMCYFSAGSYEDWRDDCGCFTSSQLGNDLDGWQGEAWLNTKDSGVRAIMEKRLDLAVSKGCDGVDPDNVDGYDNDNGLGLSETTAVDYITFLSKAAHSRGLSISLKNAGSIVESVVGLVDYEVNEECIELKECQNFDAFISAGKPVFNIEYPPEDDIDSDWTEAEIAERCQQKADPANGAADFSTVLKKHASVDEWIRTCNGTT